MQTFKRSIKLINKTNSNSQSATSKALVYKVMEEF